MSYVPAENRYEKMIYNRCGRSGLKLPAISLGLWHNFGDDTPHQTRQAIVRKAFDLGITHFDLANNYGPPPGSAEVAFGEILRTDFAGHRDELIISSKAGYNMWPGPYGEWGSRKYLLASLDQSLKRMGLDYVDIFYSHRFDPETPLEETMGALDQAVRSGKALYVGVSSYNSQRTREAADILRLAGALVLGYVFNLVLPSFGNASVAIGATVAKTEFWPMIAAWGLSTLRLVVKIVVLVLSIMVGQRLLEEFHIIDVLSNLMAPFMRIFGLSENTSVLWIVINVVGYAYGAAIIIERVKDGKMKPQEADLFNHHAALCHSLLEDTILFMAIGVPLFWITVPRLLLALVVVWFERFRRQRFRRSFKVGTV